MSKEKFDGFNVALGMFYKLQKEGVIAAYWKRPEDAFKIEVVHPKADSKDSIEEGLDEGDTDKEVVQEEFEEYYDDESPYVITRTTINDQEEEYIKKTVAQDALEKK